MRASTYVQTTTFLDTILSDNIIQEKMEDDVSTIPAFRSQINTEDPAYKANYEEMVKIVEQLHERLAQSREQGDERSIERHQKAGQLLGMLVPFISNSLT